MILETAVDKTRHEEASFELKAEYIVSQLRFLQLGFVAKFKTRKSRFQEES